MSAFIPLGQRFGQQLHTARPALKACIAGRDKCSLVIRNCQIVNVLTGEIYPGDIWIKDEWIIYASHPDDPPHNLMAEAEFDAGGCYAVPGFFDTHVHVESTMLTPRNFGEELAVWGTTTTMADPHEIVNVAGTPGFHYMMENAKGSPIRQYFLIPSCVPAVVGLENAGASFDAADIADIFEKYPETPGLAEVMDYFGLIYGDDRMVGIVQEALDRGAFVQGHCFNFHGTNLANYLLCGPASNHECLSEQDVLSFLRAGGRLNLRVTSSLASDELYKPLLQALSQVKNLDHVSLCTDDVHIGDILKDGHLNASIAKILQKSNLPIIDVIRMATINGWREYGVQCAGALAPGYLADIQLVESLGFTKKASAVFVGGKMVVREGELVVSTREKSEPECAFEAQGLKLSTVSAEAFELSLDAALSQVDVNVIALNPDGISTALAQRTLPVAEGTIAIEKHPELCFATVFNRYGTGQISTGLIEGFGLKAGAIASTIAHDGHNLIVIYRDIASAVQVVNAIIASSGGLAYVNGQGTLYTQPLKVGGLMMTDKPVKEIAAGIDSLCEAYARDNDNANPMVVATRSLTVLPTAVITDLGIIDTIQQKIIPLIVAEK